MGSVPKGFYMEGDVEQFCDVVNIEDAPSISADLTQLSARIAANGTSSIPAAGGATEESLAQPAEKGNAPRRAFSTVGSAYPGLNLGVSPKFQTER